MFLDIDSTGWPPLAQLIESIAALVQPELSGNGRHGGSCVRLCVSLQCVSCSPCHRWGQSSVCDWFWKDRRADILSSRCKPGTHSAQCPKAWPGAVWHLTRKVNLYVGAAPCLSTSAVAVPLFIYSFQFKSLIKLVLKWSPLFHPQPPPLSLSPPPPHLQTAPSTVCIH